MELVLRPAFGPPAPQRGKGHDRYSADLAVRSAALSRSMEFLRDYGWDPPGSSAEDRKNAAAIVYSYAAAPALASAEATTARMGSMRPAALRHIDVMIQDFGKEVVHDAVQIRHYVTNKLLEESDNPDPRIRMRALELLGKISEVGLFSDRKEVLVTHRTTDELREALRAKLTKLASDDIVDAELVPEDEPLDVHSLLSRLDD